MDNNTCPICQKPYGQRKRCYSCSPGKPKSGAERACQQCGKSFYVAAWQLRDTARKQGTYCSVACKHEAITGRELSTGTRYARKKDGYIVVKVGVRKYALEHRLVAARTLGRELLRHEQVHHINGDKQDNRPENLQVMSNREHQLLHGHIDKVNARRRKGP